MDGESFNLLSIAYILFLANGYYNFVTNPFTFPSGMVE